MKKRIGTPEEVARSILQMGKQELVIYCHPEDLIEVRNITDTAVVIEALSVVKGTLSVCANDIIERETYILTVVPTMKINPLDTSIYKPVWPNWNSSDLRKMENFDPELFEQVMNRVNEHQLALEAFSYKQDITVKLPSDLYERLRKSNTNNPIEDFQLLQDLISCIMSQIKE